MAAGALSRWERRQQTWQVWGVGLFNRSISRLLAVCNKALKLS